MSKYLAVLFMLEPEGIKDLIPTQNWVKEIGVRANKNPPPPMSHNQQM